MYRLCLSLFAFTVLAGASSVYGQALQIVDNIPGAFVDISNRPPLGIGDDEEIELLTSPGNFVFPFGGAVVADKGNRSV